MLKEKLMQLLFWYHLQKETFLLRLLWWHEHSISSSVFLRHSQPTTRIFVKRNLFSNCQTLLADSGAVDGCHLELSMLKECFTFNVFLQ